MTENTGRLLPLRMKISPSITGSSDQCSLVDTKTTGSSSVSELRCVEGKRSLRAATPSDLTIQCPLSSSVSDEVNDKRNKMFRTPSAHFLEVLEQQDKLPQIITRSPRSRNSGGEFTLVSNSSPVLPTSRNKKISRLRSLSSVKTSSSGSDNADTDTCSKGNNSEQININSIKKTSEKQLLRRVRSLPAIQPAQTQKQRTSGVDSENQRLFIKTDTFRPQSSGQELDFQFPEEQNGDITENKNRAEEHEEEEHCEKFSMICHWLAQCEKAQKNHKI